MCFASEGTSASKNNISCATSADDTSAALPSADTAKPKIIFKVKKKKKKRKERKRNENSAKLIKNEQTNSENYKKK